MSTNRFDLLFRFPVIFLVMSILVGLSLSTGMKQLVFDADFRRNFPPGNPHLLNIQALEQEFATADSAIIVFKSKSGNVFTPETLALIHELSEQFWLVDHSIRIDSITNYQHSWSADDVINVEPLYDVDREYDQAELDAIRRVAVNEPSLTRRVITEEGDVAAIVVTFQFDKALLREQMDLACKDVMARVNALSASHPDLEVHMNGNVISSSLMAERAIDDMTTLIPLSYIVIYVLLWLLVGSFTAVVCTLLITCLSLFGALGAAAYLGITLTMLSISTLNIIITVCIAHCVHLYVIFFDELRAGKSKKESLTTSLNQNFQAVFLTSFTTVIGFLSMNFSDMPTAHDLGNITAIGVTLAFLLSQLFLPAFLYVMPVSSKSKGFLTGVDFSGVMSQFSQFVIRNQTRVMVVALLVSCVMVALGFTVRINDRFNENIKYPHPLRLATDVIDQRLGGVYSIEYSVSSGRENGISDPEYLRQLDQFTQWLREFPKVTNVVSYADIIKRLNRNMHNDEEVHHVVPESKELAAQLLLLYEMSLPRGLDLRYLISQDRSATRVIVSFPSLSTDEMLQFESDIAAWQKANLDKELFHPGASISVTWGHLGREAMRSSIEGAALALILISVVLAIALRSIKWGAISLIPNLLPPCIGFGFWALYKGEIGLPHMTVLGITIGIIVDDTVHFLSKYLHARREGLSPEDAISQAFKYVGAALFITTFVLVAGFLLMTVSSFIPNSELGLMISSILLAAFLLDFLLLPPLILALDREKP